MEHAFGTSDPFLVGVEEELLIVDRDTHQLAANAQAVLAALDVPAERASHEAYAAEIELRSEPCRDPGQAAAQLGALRTMAAESGVGLMGAGVHPTGEWGDAPLVSAERYAEVGRMMRGLIRRTPECALHVHVAMPDPDTAVRAYNGLREHLPLLVALSANSPWWFGRDSGLASARHSLVRSYPRRGVPPPVRDYEEYSERIASVVAAGGLKDYSFVWWDVRLHPRLGTLEVREMDAQSRLSDVAALAALVQALAVYEGGRQEGIRLSSEAIAEGCFRAARDGLDASVFDGERQRPVRDIAQRTLEAAHRGARDLGTGTEAALEDVGELVRNGGGADRQRAAERHGGVGRMLERLVTETMWRPGDGRVS